jgi:hypothetical protein
MHKPCLVLGLDFCCLFSRVAASCKRDSCVPEADNSTNDIRLKGEIKLPADDQQPPLLSHLPVSGLVTSLSSTFFTSSLTT